MNINNFYVGDFPILYFIGNQSGNGDFPKSVTFDYLQQFEGKWKITWEDTNNSAKIEVKDNKFRCYGTTYTLQVDGSKVYFEWPSFKDKV